MPTLHFDEIECYNPRGTHDDVSLLAALDGGVEGSAWGPEQMRAHGVIDLTTRTEGQVFYDLSLEEMRDFTMAIQRRLW